MSSLLTSQRSHWLPPVEAWGRAAIVASFTGGLLLILAMVWTTPAYVPYLPIALGAVGIGWYLIRRPLLNLMTVLSLFVVVAAHDEGLQITEVLYGLYALGYLGAWFIHRQFFERSSIFNSAESKALGLFLACVTLSLPLTILFGGKLGAAVSEWIALLMLAFYFPVREACSRYPNGRKVILTAFLWIGLFIVVRNLFMYRAALGDAAYLWEITTGRVVTNDNILMVLSVGSFAFLTLAEGTKKFVVSLALFCAFFTALLLTQSRGYWLAFGLGAAIVFLIVGRQKKKRVILLGFATSILLIATGWLFFGENMQLIYAGLLDRFASLMSATEKDVSLINRFRETAAVWEHVKTNPILGYGMGVGYSFYDITHLYTNRDAFIHNGYIGLLYKFGIWGLVLTLVFWISSIIKGVRNFTSEHRGNLARWTSLGAAAALVAFLLSCITSNPFFLNDSTFIFGVCMGLACGVDPVPKTRTSGFSSQQAS